MTIRREGNDLVRDAFDPAAPGDYVASEAAARAVLDTLTGNEKKLFDPRYPGVLDSYLLASHREEAGGAVAVLRHKSLEHAVEVTVRVTPVAPYPGSEADVADLLTTLGRPTIQYDPQDRGALENYTFVSRRDEGGSVHLILKHVRNGKDVDVALRVAPVPPRRAYDLALDQDDLWRKAGHTVYDERQPRPR